MKPKVLRPFTAAFTGYFEQAVRVSSTCLAAHDRNRHSVPAEYAGKAVSLRAYADRIVGVAEDRAVANTPEASGGGCRSSTPALSARAGKKARRVARRGAFPAVGSPRPGAQGPGAVPRAKGRRQSLRRIVAVDPSPRTGALGSRLQPGLGARSCAPPVIANPLHRLTAPTPPARMETPDRLRLGQEPRADCDRYDQLRQRGAVHAG